MTLARWTFVIIFVGAIVIGVAMGLANWVWPGSAKISFNDVPAVGANGVIVAGSIWGVLGLIFGAIIAGIVALFTRKKKVKA